MATSPPTSSSSSPSPKPPRVASKCFEQNESIVDGAAAAKQFVVKELKRLKKPILLPWGLCLALSLFVLAIACMYLDVTWQPWQQLHHHTIAVINADKGAVLSPSTTLNLGNQIARALTGTTVFTWLVIPASQTSLDQVKHSVHVDEYWAAVFVTENFTASWAQAYYNGTTDTTEEYDNPVLFIHDQTKHYSVASSVESAVNAIVTAVGEGFQKQIYAGRLGQPAANGTVPWGAYFNPIALKAVTLHEIKKNGWYVAGFLPLIFQWSISTIAITSLIRGIHCQMSKHIRLPFLAVVGLRFAGFLFMTAITAAVIVIVLACIGMPIYHGYTAAWATLWLMAFGYLGILFVLLPLLSTYTSLFTTVILFIMLMTSGALYTQELLPSQGWKNLVPLFPLRHCVAVLQYVMFDTRPDGVGGHIGVVLGWGFGGLVLSTFTQWLGIWDPDMHTISNIKSFFCKVLLPKLRKQKQVTGDQQQSN